MRHAVDRAAVLPAVGLRGLAPQDAARSYRDVLVRAPQDNGGQHSQRRTTPARSQPDGFCDTLFIRTLSGYSRTYGAARYIAMSPAVEASVPLAGSAPSSAACTPSPRRLPSSTPNWSKEFRSQR